jgi:uncharacterized protein (TIGR02099 family)
MPSVSASPPAFSVLTSALVRLVIDVAAIAFAVFALLLLVVRFVVFPHVESYRDTLAATLSRELGHPVEISALTTGWDGWNPKLLVEGFRVRGDARGGGTPLMELPAIEMIVAWTSLPLFELRLKQLIIERPRLAVRRERSGIMHLAGIEFDPAQMTDDSPILDWILRQKRIEVRDALIVWDDDLRNAPQLVLDRVQFRLDNSFGRHRFGLKGTPPAELAAPLDLRGDLKGTSLKDWQHAEGELFVRLDYADVAAWREWLPLPGQIATGKGAMRIWFQFADGEPREVVADLELDAVKARLGEALPELDLAHLVGRVGWRTSARDREIFTRDLAFATTSGDHLDPTNLKVTLHEGASTRQPSGEIEFDRLQLEPLVTLGAHLPLSARIRIDLARFAPKGLLTRGRLRWEGPADALTAYGGSAEFANVGVVAQDAFPGATGLSGRFDVTEAHGELRVTGTNAVLDLPRVLATPVALDNLQSVVKWERRDRQTAVRIEQFEFANADAAGNVGGTYRTAVKGPGEIDLVAQVSRADVRQIHRYLPRTINEATRNWLKRALVSGNAVDARFKIAGNLAAFPFANGKGGQFLVTAKAKGVTLSYADGWPPIEDIDADFRLEGTRIRIDASRGHVADVDVTRTRAEIADFSEARLLKVEGEAAGPAPGFVRFVTESPIGAKIGIPGMAAGSSGRGRLTLALSLPLAAPDEVQTTGEFTFTDASLRLAGVPPLSRLSGMLAFNGRNVRATDVSAEVLGGPAKLSIATAGGHPRVAGNGTVNLAALRREFSYPHLDRLSGTVDWSIGIDVRPDAPAWTLESTMKGGVVDLPAPIGKTASETMPLKIERRTDEAQADADFLHVSYGGVAELAAHRKASEAGAAIDRALLSLGRAVGRSDATRAERPGLWVRADLSALNLDDWLPLMPSKASGDSARIGEMPALSGADLAVGQFEALGARFDDIKVRMREADRGWALDFDGSDSTGNATWYTSDAKAPNGRLVARFSRLTIPGRASLPAWSGADAKEAAKSNTSTVSPWPEIDVAADALISKGRDLGHLQFVAKPREVEWRIERLALDNDSGRIDADGAWRVAGPAQQTVLDIVLDTKDPAGFLARFGYPDALQGAPTKIEGQLAWAGAPHEFDYPSLSGAFRIAVGPGRFTRIEPGPAGKLLGVLSLQALPRRVTLDFRDVFSEGFTFDEVTGNVRIANGVMTTNNLKLIGPAAKIEIAGDADLAKETQHLAVHVQPPLSTSVSAGAALLFFANPLVGAAVGAGSLLAQSLMKDPIEKIFSFEYTVTGSWSDPVVTRSVAATASVAPGTPASPAAGIAR